jgi:prepilin-type N-terminal cleavage/methylation domain-containing protein
MNQCQGFTLIEVLLSLLLVSTTALGLLQQQWNNKQVHLRLKQDMHVTLTRMTAYEQNIPHIHGCKI